MEEVVQPASNDASLVDLQTESGWFQVLSELLSQPLAAHEELAQDTTSRDPHDVELLLQRLRKLVGSGHNSPSFTGKLLAFSEYLNSYFQSELSLSNYEKLRQQVNDTVLVWLRTFLRLPSSTKGSFQTDSLYLHLEMARKAINAAYPTFPEQGYRAFGDTSPVIISTRRWDWLHHVRLILGLPEESIIVTDNVLSVLENIEAEGQSGVSRPFLVVASAGGSPPFYYSDELYQLHRQALDHKFWLHVEGSQGVLSHSSLSVYSDRASVKTNLLVHCDSILFNPYSILGYPQAKAPLSVLLFPHPRPSSAEEDPLKQSKGKEEDSDPFRQVTSTSSISAIGLWFVLQHIGCNVLQDKLERADYLSHHLATSLQENPSLEVKTDVGSHFVVFRYIPLRKVYEKLERRKGKANLKENNPETISQSVDKPKEEEFPPQQKNEEVEEEGEKAKQEAEGEQQSKDNAPPAPEEIEKQDQPREERKAPSSRSTYSFLTRLFINNVNKQIRNDINQTAASVLDLDVFLGQDGNVYWLFDPYNNPDQHSASIEVLDTFIQHLSLETTLIDQSLRSRKIFEVLVEQYSAEGLVLANLSNFVGVGAVRYIPPVIRCPDGSEDLCPELSREVDELHRQAVARLQESSQLFYCTTDTKGLQAIAIHVDTDPAEKCSQYISTILDTVKEIEPSFNFLEKMGTLLSSSIKEIEARMKREVEEEENQVGLIRKLPLVGSVWNWMSPIKPIGAPGSSFNLLTTQVAQGPPSLSSSPTPKLTSPKVTPTHSLTASTDSAANPALRLSPASSSSSLLYTSERKVPGHVVMVQKTENNMPQ